MDTGVRIDEEFEFGEGASTNEGVMGATYCRSALLDESDMLFPEDPTLADRFARADSCHGESM